MLADAGAQSGERDLNDRRVDILDFQDRSLGIDDAIPDDCVDLDRHIVFGDRFLLLDRRSVDAQIDATLPLDQRNDPIEARTPGALIAAEPENDATHILVGDADACQSENNQHNDDEQRHGPLRWGMSRKGPLRMT